jgi:peptide-methionine (S)-S-oxide reductase
MNSNRLLSVFLLLSALSASCQENNISVKNLATIETMNDNNNSGNKDTATLGTGCFWCTEAIFKSLNGVDSVISGYSGGQTENPDYKEVCSGETGHAEVIQVVYDPSVISFGELLEAFWSSHDPTTLNRQGNDVGTQYRSVIFYHNEEQKKIAEQLKKELNEKKVFPDPIVTEISPYAKFYRAENYHQQYFELNGNEPYCSYVIRPKLDKFKKAFHDKLKK